MTERNGRITELTINLKRVKPAVLKEVEDRIGKPLSTLMRSDQPEGEALWALAYAVGRRLDPELTYEEAGELDVILENAPIPPTAADG